MDQMQQIDDRCQQAPEPLATQQRGDSWSYPTEKYLDGFDVMSVNFNPIQIKWY